MTKSHFLVDTTAVIALLGVAADNRATGDKHRYFQYLLREASSAMAELGIIADQVSNRKYLRGYGSDWSCKRRRRQTR